MTLTTNIKMGLFFLGAAAFLFLIKRLTKNCPKSYKDTSITLSIIFFLIIGIYYILTEI